MKHDIGQAVDCELWDGEIVGYLQSEVSGDSYVIGLVDGDGEFTGDVEIVPCWVVDDLGVAH